ncbi:MAG: hypothetical protein M5U01_09435 [Ardenticatenaceae bacterium]|nr:hypothetical protein [Ardenticatenaceae bacterium]
MPILSDGPSPSGFSRPTYAVALPPHWRFALDAAHGELTHLAATAGFGAPARPEPVRLLQVIEGFLRGGDLAPEERPRWEALRDRFARELAPAWGRGYREAEALAGDTAADAGLTLAVVAETGEELARTIYEDPGCRSWYMSGWLLAWDQQQVAGWKVESSPVGGTLTGT